MAIKCRYGDALPTGLEIAQANVDADVVVYGYALELKEIRELCD